MSVEAMKAARDYIRDVPPDAFFGALSRGTSVLAKLNEAIAAAEKAESEKDALLRQALDALEGFANITNDSQGVAGYHLSGDTAEWDEFDEVDAASNTIEAIRNHLGVKP